MAGKVTREKKSVREAEKFADEKRGDGSIQGRGKASHHELSSAYQSPPQKVDFPWVAVIICIIIDIIDIVVTFTAISIPFWFIFQLLILLPAELYYIKQREEKYSSYKISGYVDASQINALKTRAGKIQKLNSEAAKLFKAGDAAGGAKKLAAAKKVLPKGLRWFAAILDIIPFIEILPINTILMIMSYYDNKATVKAIQEGIKMMAGNTEFKITRFTGNNK